MKIALCFIISYEHILQKEQLWIDWIKPNQDIINIYFHYKSIISNKEEPTYDDDDIYNNITPKEIINKNNISGFGWLFN